SFPFYVNPEQMTQDKAEFARKGIARGKSIVTMEYAGGILMVAENPLRLQKLGEIYDRIAFAGVGKFSEFDRLRKMGIQWADVEGYRFSRDDVRGKALANVYSQVLGEEFTRSIKPFEVEIVVAEVGDENLAGHEKNALYKIGFDGTIQDQDGFIVIGGSVDNLQSHMAAHYRAGLSLGAALKLGRDALHRAENGNPDLGARHLEVALLDRTRPGRKFRRLAASEVQQLLA
ncbi:MAG TPA: proteasome subunit alpha, partial [Myxococcota bacterium]|nr:proteasome subunit alpha [Myxococcota bacterium]